MRGLTFVAATWATIIGLGWGATASAQRSQSTKQPQSGNPSSTARRPLEALSQQHIVVLPVQYLTFADTLGWSAQVPAIRDYLNTIDEELTFAFSERGLKKRWMFADGIARSVKRNPLISVDPYALDAAQLRIGSKPDQWQLQDPLASELRSLVAFSDARYVLFPVELRFVSVHGSGQAKLHVVLIDARRSQIQWAGDILGTPMLKFTPAVAADLASRLADLIAAQPH